MYRVWIILGLGIFLSAAGFSASVKEMDRKIKGHKEQLEKMQTQIDDLESEKIKLKQNEETLSKNIKKIQQKVDQSVKRQVKVNRQIHDTEEKIKQMSAKVSVYTSEKIRWEEDLLHGLRSYYAGVLGLPRLRLDLSKIWGHRINILLKSMEMKDAESRKSAAESHENRLLNNKKNLGILKIKAEEETKAQSVLKGEKDRLYQTTKGRRLIAEQEAERLHESSKMIESLITQLVQKKEKTLAAQREEQILKRSFQERRGSFDWPAQGAVVSSFGKRQHPELKILVINNGIKIRVSPKSMVKSVDRGNVVYASDFRSYGQTVIVDHGGDFFSIYGLLGEIQVREGEKIPLGKVLGFAGPEADAEIYFEIRNQGKAENPLSWLK